MNDFDAVSLRALRLFVAVLDEGSFSEVARRTGVAPSSVSRVIQQLEQHLNTQLLYRNTRALAPTEAGLAFSHAARRMLEQADEAARTLQEREQLPGGLVRINAPVVFGQRHLAPWLAALAERYPKLNVELTQTDDYVDPLHTAAVAPSSAALAAAMVDALPAGGSPVVVELGAGTGAFTAAIQARTCGRARHLAVELNPRWARLLERRHPGVEVVVADVARLPELLAERRLGPVDAVISGLPWVAYGSGPDGRRLPAVIADALAPTGFFTQFGYTWTRWAPPARRQLAELREYFADVRISRTIWRNAPPAVVHQARCPNPRK